LTHTAPTFEVREIQECTGSQGTVLKDPFENEILTLPQHHVVSYTARPSFAQALAGASLDHQMRAFADLTCLAQSQFIQLGLSYFPAFVLG